MNLMHLRYFCKLAETQHYSLAASELCISQPGLSGAISSLEEELGIQLFRKKGRNVVLTDYGKEFYSYVDKALNILDTGISIAYEHSGKLAGTITIGTLTTIHACLSRVIGKFHAQHPVVQFNIIQGQTENILPGLISSTYDIGFCSYVVPQPDITAIPVLNQQVVALVRKDHPLAGKAAVELAELAKYDILSYSLQQQIGNQFHQLLLDQNIKFLPEKTHFQFNNELYLANILLEWDYLQPVGLVASVPHISEFPDLTTIPIKDVPPDFRKVYMAYNNKANHSNAVNLFISYVREKHPFHASV